MAIVYIPALMRGLTGGAEKVTVPGSSLRQVIHNLEAVYPGMQARLLQGDDLSPALSVAVDGEVVRLGLLAPVGEQSEVHFLPAMSGG
ncbi:MAG: MoaD/ThiS family protein [Chloroflexi bacterium]|nr:MoaD/ThiS family protein [Chloroflexota bacterium]